LLSTRDALVWSVLMNTALDRMVRFDHRAPTGVAVGVPMHEPVLHSLPNGNQLLKGLRIFRTGSFKDSRGTRRTWTEDHLDMMVANYYHLASTGIFRDVPTRADHSCSIASVVGYFRDMYRDPEAPNFLCADIEFTEADAADKWKRRTFRSRSAEIGQYEDNDGNTFFPTVMGLAFVDIGAVEGLHGTSRDPATTIFHSIVDKEIPMNLEEWLAAGRSEEDWIKAVNYAAWVQAAEYAQALEDHFANAQQLGIDSTRPEPAVHSGPNTPNSPPPAPSPGPTPPPALPSALTQQHQRPLAEFRVNGQMVSDYAAVQAHVDLLEAFREDTISGVRSEYVSGLVDKNKMPKTRLATELKLVEDMTEAQFALYKQSWDESPEHPQFAQYGSSQEAGTGAPGSGPAAKPEMDELETAKSIVAQHQRTGRDAEFIKRTKSYKKLEAADQAPEL
jgi:hypothetical protein